MSIQNLGVLFKPRSIALIGASKEASSLGAILAHNLFNAGFVGPVMPVNAQHQAIEGVLAYPDPADLPEVADLAVIVAAPGSMPELISALGQRGTRAAVLVSAADAEAVGDGLLQAILAAARPYRLRIVGPDSLGVMAPAAGLNASFAHVKPKPGHLAFIAQSGAVVTSVLDWATTRDIGFSHVVSLGDMWDVDFGDVLDYLTGEGEVRGILLYIETVTHARKFMSAARAAARLKPVVVIKAGRHPAAARAAAARAAITERETLYDDQVYDAAFRRAGMLRLKDIRDLFDIVETLGMTQAPLGDRLAILTNGGGIGVMAVDALLDGGGRLAALGPDTLAALDAFLPRTWSHGNPVDILGDAQGDRYARALALLLDDPNADAILVLKAPTALASGEDAARATIATIGKSRKFVLTCWLGGTAPQQARRLFGQQHIPTYFTPEQAVRAFIDMLQYRRNQEALMQTPPSVPEAFEPDVAAARSVIAGALAAGRERLSEPEAQAVLDAYRIPVVPTRTAANPRAAAAAAAALAGPVVVKILSPDITRKSGVGGVVLDLRSPAAVREAAEAMAERVRQHRPDARIDGFAVQPMVERPDAFELIIGVREDPQFGPVILFGHGGAATQVIADTTLALPPLNMHLAREAMMRTRLFGLLQGFGGFAPAAIDDIALTLIKVSQLIIDFAEVAELDINPLLADEYGVLALDAHLRVRAPDGPAAKRLAIRPYPKELEEVLALPDGRTFMLRPVRPEDEPAFHDLFAKLSPKDIRMRFFGPKKALTHPFAARLTQIDYDREMALVLAEPGTAGRSIVYGTVHIAADPDNERAEFAILLRSDMSGLGLGPMMMRRIIDYSRQRGLQEVFGEVLRENRPMLKVCDLFKFQRHTQPDEPSVIEVRLKL